MCLPACLPAPCTIWIAEIFPGRNRRSRIIELCVGLRPRGHARVPETKTRSQRGHRAARVRLMRRHARRDGDAAADAARLAAHSQGDGGEPR